MSETSPQFDGSAQHIEKIHSVLPESYLHAAFMTGHPPSSVHESPAASHISRHLRETLRKLGYEAHSMGTAEDSQWTHEFIGLPDEWVVDPNWQQYMDKKASPFWKKMIQKKPPKVLIAQKKDLVKRLTELGVPAEKHSIWTNARKLDDSEAVFKPQTVIDDDDAEENDDGNIHGPITSYPIGPISNN